jgi:hypothetical protein
MKLLRRQQDDASGRPVWRPIPAWSWMVTAVLAVGLTAFTITAWLLTIASHAELGTDLVNAKLDAVRTGLAAGAGAGAAVGLMLAFRRQHHQEISTALTDHDATQRRITELYTKAVEQLGSDKAPVRLGGLYALERLAQDNQQQRQTIVNVICAYLRMPFPPQTPCTTPALPDSGNTAQAESEASPVNSGTIDAWQQEKQVRLTAQRILFDHLQRPALHPPVDGLPDSRFWDGMRLNLLGATLIDFSLHNCTVDEAVFGTVAFSGGAWFEGVTFSGDAFFGNAAFSDAAWFEGATFRGAARFDEATFSSDTRFDRATFSGDTRFDKAAFSGDTRFDKAAFRGNISFWRAAFSDTASFEGATFDSAAHFPETAFSLDAWFDEATFSNVARFEGATFDRGARFDKTAFNNAAWFYKATFNNVARFDEATFEKPDAVDFSQAKVRSSDGHIWPGGWQVSSDGKGGLTVTRSNNSASP